jgi:predicted DCC family thiol-disulfide oxidoreductase YuxK
MLKKINLYYDDECPFCKEYSKYVELRKIYDINIINAREAIVKINTFREKGYDINNGVIVEFEDNIFQGSDAVKIIDKNISKKSFFDKFLSQLIKLPFFKTFLYPLAKFFRIVILKLLGKSPKINY